MCLVQTTGIPELELVSLVTMRTIADTVTQELDSELVEHTTILTRVGTKSGMEEIMETNISKQWDIFWCNKIRQQCDIILYRWPLRGSPSCFTNTEGNDRQVVLYVGESHSTVAHLVIHFQSPVLPRSKESNRRTNANLKRLWHFS